VCELAWRASAVVTRAVYRLVHYLAALGVCQELPAGVKVGHSPAGDRGWQARSAPDRDRVGLGRCSEIGSSAACIGGRSGALFETRMSDASSCHCYINSSTLRRVPALPSPERGLIGRSPVAHTNDPKAERVQTPGPNHFRRLRSFPEQWCRPYVPRVLPELRTIPDPRVLDFVQLDEPEQVARLILAMPGGTPA
jgi:hypothetical protein